MGWQSSVWSSTLRCKLVYISQGIGVASHHHSLLMLVHMVKEFTNKFKSALFPYNKIDMNCSTPNNAKKKHKHGLSNM